MRGIKVCYISFYVPPAVALQGVTHTPFIGCSFKSLEICSGVCNAAMVDRQQHHPYGWSFDQYVLHAGESDHRFYGNRFGLRHKHFISKGVMASRFIPIEWGALTPSWVS